MLLDCPSRPLASALGVQIMWPAVETVFTALAVVPRVTVTTVTCLPESSVVLATMVPVKVTTASGGM